MKKAAFLLLLALIGAQASAQSCTSRQKLKASVDYIENLRCRQPDGTYVDHWSYRGITLVKGEYPISYQTSNPDGTLFIFQPPINADSGCPGNLYLFDLREGRLRGFKFGLRNACNEYHWARWSKTKRSVIALKYDVRFTYVQGKLISPDPDDSSEFGRPLSASIYADAKRYPEPFVQELPLSVGR